MSITATTVEMSDPPPITVGDWTGALGVVVALLIRGSLPKRHVVFTDRETAPGAGRTGPDHPRTAATALRHALAIMSARSQDELIDRALAAATHLTGATMAAIFTAGGAVRTHGDDEDTSRLAAVDAGSLRADHTSGLDGLGPAVVAEFGEHLVVVAAGEGRSLRLGATAVLELLLAQTREARDRLCELEQLTHRANRDPLTGLHHHRPFEQRLTESRPGRTAIITLDVDRFKKINDEYGHEAGDHALVTLVDAMRGALRDEDQLYRIGGDEFAVVVDVNGPAEAVAIARRLLAAARRVGQTVSAGAAMHVHGETARQALVRADRALYDAKRAGRDTIRLAGLSGARSARPGPAVLPGARSARAGPAAPPPGARSAGPAA
jgi:diguanylate cyclase (GGDEF)-like protein